MIEFFSSFAQRKQKSLLLAVSALFFNPISSQAQTQDFSSSTVTTGLIFTATGGAFYNTNGTTTAPSLGAYGVDNGNNGNGTAPITTLIFNERTIGTNAGATNTLTFDLANPINNFDDFSKVEVFIDIDRQGFTTQPQLLITAPDNKAGGANFLFSSAIKSSTSSYNENKVIDLTGTNYINRVTITLPSSITTAGIRVSVKIILTAGSKKANVLLVDNVALTSNNGASPLPVELTRFHAAAKPQGVALTWATATEKNNDRFEVQRSAIGNAFETIGTVKGQGNSSSENQYSFIDSHPLNCIAYYRLRQVDTDGESTFSQVATVQSELRTDLMVYPNPSAGSITVPGAIGATDYRVLNIMGQALLTGKLASNGRIELNTLNKGTFFLELTGTTGRLTQRLVRE